MLLHISLHENLDLMLLLFYKNPISFSVSQRNEGYNRYATRHTTRKEQRNIGMWTSYSAAFYAAILYLVISVNAGYGLVREKEARST